MASKETYPLQPDDEPQEPRPQPQGARVDPAPDVEPVPLESADGPAGPGGPAPAEADPPASSVKALDVCPNCGASMRQTDTLVCMRLSEFLQWFAGLNRRLRAGTVSRGSVIASAQATASMSRYVST